MPSLDHEALLELFRRNPSLAPTLLERVRGVPVPAHEELEVREAELAEVTPVSYRADLLVLLRTRASAPRLAIIVEIQLRRDEAKRFSWPYYTAAARARWRCPACLVVVTPDARVARWARTTVETGHPGWTFAPVVFGPETIPVVTELERARELPELSVLSALAHASEPDGIEVAFAAVVGVSTAGLAAEHAGFYYDLVLTSLDGASRRALEALMQERGYAYRSDFARHYFAKGREEGREEGQVEGLSQAVLTALEARGLEPTEEQRRRVRWCGDPELLERWRRRALSVAAVEELFDDD